MKIQKKTLERTNLACPSEWTCKTECGIDLKLSFRLGVLKVLKESKLVVSDSKDEFDISSYLSDEDLEFLLKKNNLID